MKIYITHCSAKKDPSIKNTGIKITPERLYTAKPTQRFMNACKKKKVAWAIFSDKYGVWFPQIKHEWYEKDPDTVTESEFKDLVRDFEVKLGNYDIIYFYYNPGRFHPLYKKLLEKVKVKGKVILFSHLFQIDGEKG